jgi:hypothetical protein
LKDIFAKNGYPSRFVQKTIQSVKVIPKAAQAEKKPVYISLPFKGDVVAELMTRRLKKSIEDTYAAAQLRVVFRSKPIISLQMKDRLPRFSTSYCVYSFECPCRASYIGRTTRRLAERIREHCPAWLTRNVVKSTSSAIASHVIETSHSFISSEAFQVVYRVPSIHSKLAKSRLLAVAEAISIRLRNPDLCAQKQFVRALQLNWPATSSSRSRMS